MRKFVFVIALVVFSLASSVADAGIFRGRRGGSCGPEGCGTTQGTVLAQPSQATPQPAPVPKGQEGIAPAPKSVPAPATKAAPPVSDCATGDEGEGRGGRIRKILSIFHLRGHGHLLGRCGGGRGRGGCN